MPYQMTLSDEDECSPSFVLVDNSAHPKWTRLSVDVADTPGLLRTISWVLNGMGVRVQSATLLTHKKNAQDVFWLTTWSGHKLTDSQATLLAERVQDFVIVCETRRVLPQEWECRNLRVSNSEHPAWTVLTIEGEPERQGFLLELASVLSGTGVQIQEAHIQSAPLDEDDMGGAAATPDSLAGKPPKRPVAVAPPDYGFSQGRYFKFLLSDEAGAKLDASRVGALLFTYDVFTDKRHMPLVAPNMDTYMRDLSTADA